MLEGNVVREGRFTMHHPTTRRAFLSAAGVSAAGLLLPQRSTAAAVSAPTAPVAVSQCHSYGAESSAALARMFDQLGGLGSLVKGKTVGIKINLTGTPETRLGHYRSEQSHWTHYAIIGATIEQMFRAGATRVRLLESPWATTDPLEEYMLGGGWEPRDLLNAGPKVEMENTGYLGTGKRYSHFNVPNGGLLFKSYELNHSYEDLDVFVSIAKMKNHATCGVTLSMKNCFGITPCTIYGEASAEDGGPTVVPRGGRGSVFHNGSRQPSKPAVAENDKKTPRDGGYRVSRAVADLVAARPIHLAIVEGIETMTGGEGPWIQGSRYLAPGLLVAGLNPVTTDAVSMALMGYDPMADRGTAPFENCDNTLRLAESLGVGTRDLKRIEVLGTPIDKAKVDFRAALKS
jgi:uncharacterized protein (DUF362 family)